MIRVKDQEEQLTSLPEHWFPGQKQSIRNGSGGMNNTTRFVVVDGTSYVLRIYETHRDRAKIQFEHAVLMALSCQKLPYRLPIPIPLPDGGTIKAIDSEEGKLAALFTFTEGCNPVWEHANQVRYFGAAVGQLSKALAVIELNLKPVYSPYYEIEQIHPRCTPEAIQQFCLYPPEAFEAKKTTLQYIWNRFLAFYEAIPELKKLPHQLVHGDINGSNLLIHPNNEIAAVLDFEFVTEDVRVMELAVCLSDLIDPALPEMKLWELCAAFYEGYRPFIDLKDDELRLIPQLIELRRLDVFVHFLGRYLDGVDAQGVLADIIDNTTEKVAWLESHHDKLASIFER
ncbi:phosphotransferase [Paenibacillus sp. SI8]|uniref:phosphotransferase n=1 Tax=unclassified Paenibacillus TaxID=185978 RepID=UPI00346780D0